jgi:hypothetical protein
MCLIVAVVVNGDGDGDRGNSDDRMTGTVENSDNGDGSSRNGTDWEIE